MKTLDYFDALPPRPKPWAAFDGLHRQTEKTRSSLKNYQVIDLSKIWKDELLPLIDKSDELQKIHSICMEGFLADEPHGGLYNEHQHGGAWELTTSTHHLDKVFKKLHAARDAGDPIANLYYKISDTLLSNGLANEVQAALEASLDAILRRFSPTREEPEYWTPRHACHWTNTWAYFLAKAWRPEGRWKVRTTIDHTTVVDTKAKQVFDVLMYDFPIDEIRKVGNFK